MLLFIPLDYFWMTTSDSLTVSKVLWENISNHLIRHRGEHHDRGTSEQHNVPHRPDDVQWHTGKGGFTADKD